MIYLSNLLRDKQGNQTVSASGLQFLLYNMITAESDGGRPLRNAQEDETSQYLLLIGEVLAATS